MASRRRGQCTLRNYGAIRRNSQTLHPQFAHCPSHLCRYNKESQLPTGLGQALYTRFHNLPALDLASAAALVLAFSEFDDSEEAWRKYDKLSFRDLCVKLGVSKRLYDEAFEPMILTGLFAPGEQCSAAAALGMAYFFVLKHQQSFDVRWAKGDIGEKIFAPWVEQLEGRGVRFLQNTKAVDFEASDDGRQISAVRCAVAGEESIVECDDIVFALGGGALGALSRSPALAKSAEFRAFSNLRGTSVLATRLWLDRRVSTPYTANACWGFDEGVGMTWFDVGRLHAPKYDDEPGSVIEVDFYHCNQLLGLTDEAIVEKVKRDLDKMVPGFGDAAVVDAAVVRLPNAVNWYYPGSYRHMPETKSRSFANAYFAGDIVKTRHGSWSQEKAYVTGLEAANALLGRGAAHGVLPLDADEPHVAAGRLVAGALPGSLVDFLR